MEASATSKALEAVLRRLSVDQLNEADDGMNVDNDLGSLGQASLQPYAIIKPQDCKDIQSIMRAMIAGFTTQYEGR